MSAFVAARSLLVTLQFGKSRFIAFQNRLAVAHDQLLERGSKRNEKFPHIAKKEI